MAPGAHGLHAERAILRDLDGRLSWRERRVLRAHLRDCIGCAGFARFQQQQRAALRSLRLVPVPNSLQVFRPGGV
ncbi:MAG: zf-HC2 domain-containing protein [Actinobacteria bacterium]|nr:MAG: zf-HC2 domain-containing protein [Actinomycetota bacterium]